MESRFSCMVWYNASVGGYVAMSPEWGAGAVGVGPCRSSAVQHLEALLEQLAHEGQADDATTTAGPGDLTAAMEWESARLRAASGGADSGRGPRRFRTGT